MRDGGDARPGLGWGHSLLCHQPEALPHYRQLPLPHVFKQQHPLAGEPQHFGRHESLSVGAVVLGPEALPHYRQLPLPHVFKQQHPLAGEPQHFGRHESLSVGAVVLGALSIS